MGEQQAQRLREGASSQELFHISPSQPHDYRTEQPETFWIQRAPQLPVCERDQVFGGRGRRRGEAALFWLESWVCPHSGSVLQGVSNIRTLDTPFRKNCSFSTPVPLSLGQPLPYEPEDYSH